jgi:sortase (surface protein transpeptidase)
VNLNVMVLEGTDPWTLNRAVGHIESTALPEEQVMSESQLTAMGTFEISAHRSGR